MNQDTTNRHQISEGMFEATEPAAGAPSIEGLARYHPNIPMGRMQECADGDYFAVADVERRLATQSAKQGAQAPVWISVDSAIPADGAVVMICGDKRHDKGKYQAVAKVLGGFFFDDDDEEEGEYINVTHWQPLPALPGAVPAAQVQAEVRQAAEVDEQKGGAA